MTALITLILSSKAAQALLGLIAAVLGVKAYGALQRRSVAKQARQETALKNATDRAHTLEGMLHAETDLNADAARVGMRDRPADQR